MPNVMVALPKAVKFAAVPQTRQRFSEELSMFNNFFRLSMHASHAKIQPDKFVRWRQNGDFLRPVFLASRVTHISDMHSKFALRPHHVWNYGRHPMCGR